MNASHKFFIIAFIAIGAASVPAGETPPALRLAEQAIQPALSGLAPKPIVKREHGEGGPVLVIQYEPRKFQVYSSDMTGQWSTNAREEIGPKANGFVLTLNIEKLGEPEQRTTPQTVREPYWETFLDLTPIAGTTNQVYWALSSGPRTDRALLERLKQAVWNLAANKSAEGASPGVTTNKVNDREVK